LTTRKASEAPPRPERNTAIEIMLWREFSVGLDSVKEEGE
jgi:hypothetical protein